MKPYMICIVYVDDTIIAGPNYKATEEEINVLGFNKINNVIHLNSAMKVKLDLILAYALNDRRN